MNLPRTKITHHRLQKTTPKFLTTLLPSLSLSRPHPRNLRPPRPFNLLLPIANDQITNLDTLFVDTLNPSQLSSSALMGHFSRLAVCSLVHLFLPILNGILRIAADNLIKIWSPFTGDLIRNLNGHTKGLSDVAWSTDGTYLASASDDTTIRIWNVDTVRSFPQYTRILKENTAKARA